MNRSIFLKTLDVVAASCLTSIFLYGVFVLILMEFNIFLWYFVIRYIYIFLLILFTLGILGTKIENSQDKKHII